MALPEQDRMGRVRALRKEGARYEGKGFDLAEGVPHSKAVLGNVRALWLSPSAGERAVPVSPYSVSFTLREARCFWAFLANPGIHPRTSQGDSFGARPLCACQEGTMGMPRGAGPTALTVLTLAPGGCFLSSCCGRVSSCLLLEQDWGQSPHPTQVPAPGRSSLVRVGALWDGASGCPIWS